MTTTPPKDRAAEIENFNHSLLRQNAHLLSVLSQIRDCLDPTVAITGPNVDAAIYALSYVFGERGGQYGRFCAPGAHEWQPTRDYSPTGFSAHATGRWCPVCGKIEALQNNSHI